MKAEAWPAACSLYYVRMGVQEGTPDWATPSAGDEAASSARLIDEVLLAE